MKRVPRKLVHKNKHTHRNFSVVYIGESSHSQFQCLLVINSIVFILKIKQLLFKNNLMKVIAIVKCHSYLNQKVNCEPTL